MVIQYTCVQHSWHMCVFCVVLEHSCLHIGKYNNCYSIFTWVIWLNINWWPDTMNKCINICNCEHLLCLYTLIWNLNITMLTSWKQMAFLTVFQNIYLMTNFNRKRAKKKKPTPSAGPASHSNPDEPSHYSRYRTDWLVVDL